MAISTYTLSGSVFASDKSALESAVITAKLDKADYTPGGAHLPKIQKATSDASGNWSLSLVSNLDGTQDSRYIIEIRESASGGVLSRSTVQMPKGAADLANLVDKQPVTTEYSTAAALSAAEAEDAKDAAEGFRDEAETFKNTASTKASDASTSASEASTSASNASTSASEASTSESEAEGYRDEVLGSLEDRTTPITVSGTSIDLSQDGVYYKLTLDGNVTLTFDNPSAGVNAFTIEVDHVSGTITWPSSVKWPFDVTPIYATGNKHLFMFVSSDGGTTYRGSALVDYPA